MAQKNKNKEREKVDRNICLENHEHVKNEPQFAA
jgi:hypothetical protein